MYSLLSVSSTFGKCRRACQGTNTEYGSLSICLYAVQVPQLKVKMIYDEPVIMPVLSETYNSESVIVWNAGGCRIPQANTCSPAYLKSLVSMFFLHSPVAHCEVFPLSKAKQDVFLHHRPVCQPTGCLPSGLGPTSETPSHIARLAPTSHGLTSSAFGF